nr:hypothetical protein Iba_chr09cCG13920 [Ipomoea batatas]
MNNINLGDERAKPGAAALISLPGLSVITLLGLTGTSSEIVAGGASDICAEPTLAAAAETAGTKQVKDTRVTTKREKMLGILKSGAHEQDAKSPDFRRLFL